jgi:hypothetical protein
VVETGTNILVRGRNIDLSNQNANESLKHQGLLERAVTHEMTSDKLKSAVINGYLCSDQQTVRQNMQPLYNRERCQRRD